MPIVRHWKGRPRGLREVPDQITNAPEYAGKDWPVREVLLSTCGGWMKFTFDNGVVDYWRLEAGTGSWVYSQTEPDFTKPAPAVADGVDNTGGGPVG